MADLDYIIGLKDQISGPATAAGNAIAKLADRLQATKKIQEQYERLGVKTRDAAVLASKAQAEAARSQAKAETKAAQETKAAASASSKAQAESSARIVEGFGLVAGGAAIAATAVLAAAAAFGALVYKGATLAIEASEFKGDTMDALELLLGTQEAAGDAYNRINDLSSKLPLPRKQAFELGQDLILAGITQQKQLDESITSIANLQQLGKGGQAGAEKIKTLLEKSSQTGKFDFKAKQLTGTGVSVDALTKNIAEGLGKSVEVTKEMLKDGKVEAQIGIDALNKTLNQKIGGIAAKQMTDFGVQIQKLSDWFVKLFEDVDTDGFKTGLADVFKIFSDGTASGDFFKTTVVSGFNAVFKAATAVLPYIKRGIYAVIISAQQLYIWLNPIVLKLEQIWQTYKFSDKLSTALTGIKYIVEGIAVSAAIMMAPFILTTAIVWTLITAVGYVWSKIATVGIAIIKWFDELGMQFLTWAGGLADKIINGLVDGIKAGIGKVRSVFEFLGLSAKTATEDTMEVHSPSKVMRQIGKYSAEGFALGPSDVDVSSPYADMANQAISAPVAQIGASNMSSSKASGSVVIDIGGITLQVTGVANAEGLAQVLPGMLADTFEQIAIQFGGNLGDA